MLHVFVKAKFVEDSPESLFKKMADGTFRTPNPF